MKKILDKILKEDPKAIDDSYNALKNIPDEEKTALIEVDGQEYNIPFKLIERYSEKLRGTNLGNASKQEQEIVDSMGRNPDAVNSMELVNEAYKDSPLVFEPAPDEHGNPDLKRLDQSKSFFGHGGYANEYGHVSDEEEYELMNPRSKKDRVLELKNKITQR